MGRDKGALQPATPYPPTVERDGLYYLPPPHSLRLHQKSAFGRRCKDEGVLLTPVELIYCHWFRFIPLPEPTNQWFAEQLELNPRLEAHLIAMELMRTGHDICVPVEQLSHRFAEVPDATWGLGWPRGSPWIKEAPSSQVRVHRTNDEVDWHELLEWFDDVSDRGQDPFLCVVDDEMEGTVYQLSQPNLEGVHRAPSSLSQEEQEHVQSLLKKASFSGTSVYLPEVTGWPLNAVGVEHFSGRMLTTSEAGLFDAKAQPAEDSISLHSFLLNLGLMLRPGFKYGSLWRAYEHPIGEEHAPWLIQPVDLAPVNWEGVCLSARLAEGVHKSWVCAFEDDRLGWRFLSIARRS